jgi:hypothetical protein
MDSALSYVISVSAGTGCYRHIRIAAKDTLYDLHAAILNAFDFKDDQAHVFFMDNILWNEKDSYRSNYPRKNKRETRNIPLESLALYVGMLFKYVFDFGEPWIFQCKVLRSLDEAVSAPSVIRRQGESPEQYAREADAEAAGDEEEPRYIEFPKIYTPFRLNRMYKKLGMPEETVRLLHTYFDAMARLYGVIPLRKALEIVNQQNEPIPEKTFAAFAEIVRHEEHDYSILGEDELFMDSEPTAPLDRELIAEHLYTIDLDDYEELEAAQQGKPYYIPPKQELLKYADPDYYESTPQRDAMWHFLRHDLRMSGDRTEDFMYELLLYTEMGERDFQVVLDDMERMGLRFRTESALEKFIQLYSDLNNHSRMYHNRGFTPMEVMASLPPEERVPKAIVIGPNMTAALQKGDMDIEELRAGIFGKNMPSEQLRQSMLAELDRIKKTMTPAPVKDAAKKIGRNDPCPCGSGKKYKNCCLGKGE